MSAKNILLIKKKNTLKIIVFIFLQIASLYADELYKEGYITMACKFYALSSRSFEEICLKFIKDNEYEYLQRKIYCIDFLLDYLIDKLK